MTGPGLWIRIQHRFGPRMTEWILAVITALWGAVLLLPERTFDQPTWSGFRIIFGDETLLGFIMLALGFLRLGGLVVNGARKNVTPWIRVVSASLGFLLFVGITTGYALSGVVSTWLAIYPVFALVELMNIYRAAHDAGESNAAP
ncbi:hypothetical protein EMQ25_05805 [Arsenicitalea aurantiaca]|uniref:DUF4345 domain-containing protein n=1 Tax=Arsenicitalea aurantiaca TaxID=1783274 RepID=A0A433XF25_9HYPH|nr:hypothetical protein [Arsenicitalea aurantiaca]RUT32660.1 hypothetical protein EMQ25_05805 [Arsenicitalea aurantiaca]